MKEGWTIGKFSDFFDLQMGKTPSRDNPSYWGGTNTWVSIADMNCGKYIYSTKEQITNQAISESGIHRVSKDTVIMSFKLSIGKTAIAAKDLYTNEAIMSFNTIEGYEIIPDYIYYYLRGYKWQGMNKAVMGMTLNKKTISNNIFSFPNTLQQQHIVEELDLLSSIIEKKKNQLNELNNLAHSLFYEMFGDPVTNEKGWTVKKINDICCSIVRGPFGSALKKEFFVERDETTYKVYEQKHAIQKNANIGSYYVTEQKFNELSRFEVKSGDIIMSCSGTIGEFYKIPQDAERGLMNQALLKFTLNDSVCHHYFLFMMDYVKQNFIIRGSGLQNIGSVKVVKDMSFGLPPVAFQQQFAEKVQTIEHQKELIKKSIEEVETLFNSRMDYYFN